MNEDLATLPAQLIKIAEQFPHKVAIQAKRGDSYRQYTYKDFLETSQCLAFSLIKLGLKKGERVALILENRPEWGFIYFGIIFSGATAVPIDSQSSFQELGYILSDSEAKLAFVSANLIPLLEKLTKNLPQLEKIVVLDYEVQSLKFIPFSKLLAEKSPTSLPQVTPQDLASLLYTSGTTSKPKGVMLTQKNFYSNFLSIAKLGLVSSKDNIISILPLHHAYPFMVTFIVPLLLGAKITYPLTLKREELLSCLRETQATILVGVPQIFHMFYKQIKDKIKDLPFLLRMLLLGLIEILGKIRKYTGINLSKLVLSKIHGSFGKKLRFFASGGAKLDETAAKFLIKIGFTIIEGYGLTETSPVLTFNPLKRAKIGSVGKALPGVELKVINPDKEGIGEVAVRGPNVMKGYFKGEQETQEVLRDNWFYTGDLGFLDSEGYLYLTGRKNELIVLSSGKNISPQEIESHYSQSPFVKELCVLAVGEREKKLKAVVVPALECYRRVGEVNIQGRINWDFDTFSKQLPAYKRIMGFTIIREDLPRTRLGKIKRYEVKAKYLEQLQGLKLDKPKPKLPSPDDLEILSSPITKKVKQILQKELNIKKDFSLDDHLELDLGLDSLGRVELATALEKVFEIKIPDSLMTQSFTVREIIWGVQKLISQRQLPVKDVPIAQVKAVFWSKLLTQDPQEDIIKRIDLSSTWKANLFIFISSSILYLTFKIFWRLKIYGEKNIPKEGPFILCSNHASFLDGFLLFASTPLYLKPKIYTLGLRAYFELPLIRNMVRLIKIIPIDPSLQLVEAMQACSYVLRNNKAICIFPEGGRSIDGEVKEFKKGVGILAKELNLALVPVYIQGSYESWSRLQPFPKPYPIRVIFGQPFDCQRLKERGLSLGAGDDYQAIAWGIREEVINLKKKYK